MDAIKVSLVVTCKNNAQTIDECLRSLVEQDYPRDYIEIIVVDAFSTDTTLEIARKYTSKAYSEKLNAAAAYNYAMKIASYETLGFVDADAKVEREWLKKLVPHLNDPRVAGVSGSIETWNTTNPWARGIGYELKNRYNRIGRYAGRIATMNLLLKRSVIEEAGGWNESLPSQYDTDLGYKIKSKGYKFAYEPTAKCYHFNRQTVRAYWRQQLQYGKNTLKLYFMHSALIKGDEITDFGMNIQPTLLAAIIVLFLLGIVPFLRIFWYASGLVLAGILIYYVFSAAKISLKFKDASAMRLVLLYFVRAFAWLCGATISIANLIASITRR